MGVLNFKLKTIYGNKKSNGSNEFFAPKKYEKFIEKCEQLYSINYRKDIHHALFYDKDKKEYPQTRYPDNASDRFLAVVLPVLHADASIDLEHSEYYLSVSFLY